MATVVLRFSEGAYIITVDGEEIPVYEGMIVEDGDIFVGDITTIEDPNAVDPGADIASLPPEVIAEQQAILAGADPTQVTEAPAAGGDRGLDGPVNEDGGGRSFIALDRTGLEVDPTAGYRTGTFGSTVETPEEEQPLVLSEVPPEETPPTSEPPTEPPVPPQPPEEPPEDPEDPVVTTIVETKTEVDTEVETQTVVGDEYETGRSSDTTTTETHDEDGNLTKVVTTTTTTVSYDKDTSTITTTTTTTRTYEREVTTTTYPDGSEEVVTGEWELTDTDVSATQNTETTTAPREETSVNTVVDNMPVANDDTFTVDENTTLESTVVNNDSESGDGVHTYSLIGESIPGLTFRDDGSFEYVAGDVEDDTEVTFQYKITDEDGDSDTATVTINIDDVLDPEEPEETTETWFISQGGNHVGSDGPTNVDYELVTGATGRHSGDMDLVISNKGLGDYKVQAGDTVTFTFELVHTDAVYGDDYTLDIVSKAPQYDIGSWGVSSGILTVNIEYNGTNDFNLAGNTFAIEVTSTKDDGHANVGFDMTSVTHHDVSANVDVGMTQWETNDDVVIGLNSSSDFIPETRDLPVE